MDKQYSDWQNDTRIKELQEAAAEGFKARDKLGQAFAREEGKSAAYLSLGSNAAKQEFRRKWAQARLDKVLCKKVTKEGERRENIKDGKYLTFSRIVR
eukprot:10477642-Alexandrium_andersonii.AAC.1